MKKLFVCIMLFPIIISAQYWGERSTEQSFEQSELFFKSHYLNTFGMPNFKDAAIGLIDDPFLNLYLNPANFPELKNGTMHFYLDFRGDRTSAPVIDNYVVPLYYADIYYRPYVDPRWFSQSRTEPEPTVSFGLLMYPIKEITDRFFVGGTYQFINRQEKFYTLPYWIYRSNYYYMFADNAKESAVTPIKDRYSSKDEMLTKAHMYSAFAGLKLLDNLSIGASLNGVIHSRNGGYLYSTSDEYGNTDKNDWSNSYGQDKMQDYDHLDFSGGIRYEIIPGIGLGAKAGMLKGDATQDYSSHSDYFYQYNTPNVTADWSYYFSNSSTMQKWNQDGKTKYISFNLFRKKDGKEFSGYYRYSKTDIDLINSSVIKDTSFHTSRYISSYDITTYNYLGNSATFDIRSGTGTKESIKHEGSVSLKWRLTPSSAVSIGVYSSQSENTISSNEPVTAIRHSQYSWNNSRGENYNSLWNSTELKVLEWKYNAKYWTLQIPVVVEFHFAEYFDLTLAVNRILNGWEITDQTIAYFSLREQNINGEIKRETNFGERYTQPSQKITENFTDFITKLDVAISPEFKISVLLDPEFEHQFRVAQWWLAFNAEL